MNFKLRYLEYFFYTSNIEFMTFNTLKKEIRHLLIHKGLINKDFYLQSQIVWNKDMDIQNFELFLEKYNKIIDIYINENKFQNIIQKKENVLYLRFLLKIYYSTMNFKYSENINQNINQKINQIKEDSELGGKITILTEKYFLET